MDNYDEEYKRLGINLAYFIRYKKITQRDFSKMIRIHESYLSGILTGKQKPSLSLLISSSKILSLRSPGVLFDFRAEQSIGLERYFLS